MTLNRIFIRRLARSAGSFTTDYCRRHKHPVNAALHIVGVPAVVLGLCQIFGGRGPRAKFFGAFLIVFGYILQFLGHKQQGNEVGEVTLIKSLVAKLQAASEKNLQRGTAYGADSDAWGNRSGADGREPAHAQPSGPKNGHNGHNGHKGNGDKRGGGRYIFWWKTSH
ncbi:MAG: DUF962 domain-containing protein [Cyanobacteria bacterium REEB67]|nr:DUF962 domain-containing protein [Cyanobacteria bacterium REEB67]